jgi:dolichol-phosphate mannosyltransferase
MKINPKNSQRALVFVPTFNCEAQISRVISKLSFTVSQKFDVLILDNCSEDNTLKVSIDLAKQIGGKRHFFIYRNERNLGLGGSHKVASRFAIKNGYDILIVLHGDDQADCLDLFNSLDYSFFEEAELSCLLGSRFMRDSKSYGYGLVRVLGNRILMLLYPRSKGSRISDMGSGLNAYKTELLRKVDWKRIPDDLTFNNVLLLETLKNNFSLRFFPISWSSEDQKSNAKLFRQGLLILRAVLEYRLGLNFNRGSSLVELPLEQIQFDSKQNA